MSARSASDARALALRIVAQREALRRLEELHRENPIRWVRPPGAATPRPFTYFPKQLEAFQEFCPAMLDLPPNYDWVADFATGKIAKKKLFGFLAGNRAGKSEWATRLFISAAIGVNPARMHELPQDPRTWKLGPARLIWAIMPTFDKSQEVQQKYVWDRLPRCLMKTGTVWNEKSGFYGKVCPLVNGSRIVFKTAEQDLNTFEGDSVHLVWADEAMPLPYVQAALVRTTDTRGTVIWTAWPSMPALQEVFIERRLSRDSPELSEAEVGYVSAGMADNLSLSADEIALQLKMVDPTERMGRIFGQFSFAEGLVYPEFQPRIHVRCDSVPCPMPRTWTRYELIDPGWANPCAVNFCCIDPSGNRGVYDEIYVRNHTVAEIAALIQGRRWFWSGKLTKPEHDEYEARVLIRRTMHPSMPTLQGEAVEALRLQQLMQEYRRRCGGDCAPFQTQIDEAARQGKQSAAADEVAQFRECGINVVPKPNKPKDAQRKLLRDWLRPIDGHVGFWVAEHCKDTRWEFAHHSFKAMDPTLREYKGDKEIVVDAHNHAISNLERWAASRPSWIPDAASTRRDDDAPGQPRNRFAGRG